MREVADGEVELEIVVIMIHVGDEKERVCIIQDKRRSGVACANVEFDVVLGSFASGDNIIAFTFTWNEGCVFVDFKMEGVVRTMGVNGPAFRFATGKAGRDRTHPNRSSKG